jgi:hypothetical protein
MARKRHHKFKKGEFHPVKRPGAATRKAHAAGESVGEWARKNYHAGGLKGKEARFAVIAKKWRHGGKRGRRRTSR